MRTIKMLPLLVFLFVVLAHANGQSKEPSAEHKKLLAIVGRWTIEGMEDTFLETCEMYPGGYFLVCNTEFKTQSGGLNKGVSILGYSTEGNHVTYYNYSSSGESRTLKGKIDETGNLFFEGEELIKGKSIKSRVVMTKNGENYNFKEDTSIDNGPWTTSTEFVYTRVKQ